MTTHRKHHFYSRLITFDEYILILDDLEITSDERIHLTTIIQSNLHYTIIDIVLSNLSKEDKKIFMHIAQENNHDKTWEFLKRKTNNIEKQIIKAAEELKKEMLSDVQETKRKN